MNLYLLESAGSYLLSEEVGTGGSLPSTIQRDYVYASNAQQILREGVIDLTLNLNISGDVTIKPTLYLGDPLNNVILLDGDARRSASAILTWEWLREAYEPEILDVGLTLRLESTDHTAGLTSATTVSESTVSLDIRSGGYEEQKAFTLSNFTRYMKPEYFFGFTTTHVKEDITIDVFSTTRTHEFIDIDVYSTTSVMEEIDLPLFSVTNMVIPNLTTYIENLKMDDTVLGDSLGVLKSGRWVSDMYDGNYDLIVPPESIKSPELWDITKKVGDSFTRATNNLLLNDDLPNTDIQMFYPSATYIGDYVYRDGEWQLPIGYSTTSSYYVRFSFDAPRYLSSLWLMVRHGEDSSSLSVSLRSQEAERVLAQYVSSTEIAEVFMFPAPSYPYDIDLNILNDSGDAPGFNGTLAAVLYST